MKYSISNTLVHIKRKTKKQRKIYFFAFVVLFILASTYLCLGKTIYPIDVVMKVLLGNDINGASFTIVQLRLPRMLVGLLGGMALGAAGNTFQTMLRNPLASPDIIGVTAGTSMTAVFCLLILQISGSIVSMISILSGVGISAILYLFSKGRGFSGSRMILIGLGLQAMMNAVISFILLRANQQNAASAMRWLSGSLAGMQMENAVILTFIVIFCMSILIILEKPLQTMELGEEISISLGVRTGRFRCLNIICAVIMIAFTTSICGPIAFVAFLAGPIAKYIVGAGASRTFISGVVGACLVLLADQLGHLLFRTQYPVGVVTGILGAPYLLFLLIRMNKTGGAS